MFRKGCALVSSNQPERPTVTLSVNGRLCVYGFHTFFSIQSLAEVLLLTIRKNSVEDICGNKAVFAGLVWKLPDIANSVQNLSSSQTHQVWVTQGVADTSTVISEKPNLKNTYLGVWKLAEMAAANLLWKKHIALDQKQRWCFSWNICHFCVPQGREDIFDVETCRWLCLALYYLHSNLGNGLSK